MIKAEEIRLHPDWPKTKSVEIFTTRGQVLKALAAQASHDADEVCLIIIEEDK